VEARTGILTADGARLHFRVVGEGPAIVVLHGGPDFGYDYLVPELDRLAGRSRVVYYDQRGRGRSAHGVRPDDVTIESEVDDLDHVRRHFGLTSMAVLGHSWGGVLAMEYASRRPERLSHLILMNTAPASHEDALTFRQHLRRIRPAGDAETMQSLATSAAFRAGDLDVEAEYYRIHYRPTLSAPELLERLVRRLRTNATPERVLTARAIEDRLYDRTWSSPGYDLLPGLRRLDVPTLVLHGENDFVPVELAAHIAEAIPTARLVVLPQLGHFAYLEAPDAVLRHVQELLTGGTEQRTVRGIGLPACLSSSGSPDTLDPVTTRQLVLIRHAKADEGGIDRERPLADRGVAEAPAIGRWLAQRRIAPDRVVVSPARRARQTWELAADELGPTAEPVLDDRVYRNTVEDLLEIVRETPDDVTTLAIVGHNPGIQNLAVTLDDGRGDDAGRRELATRYRTSGVAVLDVGDSWAEVRSGTLTSFAAPR
jgi:phosphohistidine phosphatase SixA